MGTNDVASAIKAYEDAYYEAFRNQMQQYAELTDAFPDFLMGPKRVVATQVRDGVVVSHWSAEHDSFEFNVSERGVSDEIEIITNDGTTPNVRGSILPDYVEGLGIELAQAEIRNGTLEVPGDLVWCSPWDRVEVRPFEEALWHPQLGSANGGKVALEFVAAHLMRLKNTTHPNIVHEKMKETIQRFVSLVANNPGEEAVQVFLAENPILLDATAVKVLPKHKLGAEFVTDFVIQLPNDRYILVEIEAPKHKLFTKSGDPTKELTHAQRQVEDWQGWLSENMAYARNNLPGLADPEYWVVIGRRLHITPRDRAALASRNAALHRIRVLTYDDLIDRVEAQLKNLSSM